MMPLSQCVLVQAERNCIQQARRSYSRSIWAQSKNYLRRAQINTTSRAAFLQRSMARSPTVSSSFSTFAEHTQSTFTDSSSSHHDHVHIDTARGDILQAALALVHEHGWTDDAIAAAVISKGFPITMTGLVNTSDLISHAMQTANEQFRVQLDQMLIPRWMTSIPPTPVPDRIAEAIQARLMWIVPFVQSRTWHDGMALGAMPYNILTTQTQLHDIVLDLTRAVTQGERNLSWGPLEQTAIGAVYVATELHLLTDTSHDYTDTWSFLRQRVSELDMLANVSRTTTDTLGGVFPLGSSGSNSSQLEDTIMVASAVASSLAGAVASLTLSSSAAIRTVRTAAESAAAFVPPFLHPVKATSNTSTAIASNETTRTPDGTQPGDYDIGNPFPSDGSLAGEGNSEQSVEATASIQK